MDLVVFTVYDSKAEAFLQPFFSQSRGTAIRSFAEAAQDQQHQFHKHAADFTLFELGTFDQVTAKFSMSDAPVNLGTALMYVEQRGVDNVSHIRGEA